MRPLGPDGKAGLSSGMAKALVRTSSSVMATSCSCPVLQSLAPVLREVEGGDPLQVVRPIQHLLVALQRYGMYVIDNSGHAKVMLEYDGTAHWNGAVDQNTVSRIPLTSFRVVVP